ncbi:efflux RND transporter periplasmic adaptor subunit [Anditalea andensis]|uniref:Hemolysin D n=1 Tax=Anditalea andensis TaxID=1048983 RepID=A0A074L526_9BACT|nr:efflux RND transporter periplasmic adaptor subunit [Anditalea andensis]KEO75570.1 hemolysin D [Anditalea andensis]
MKNSIRLFSILAMLICLGCHSEKHHEAEMLTLTVTHPIIQDTVIFQQYVSQIHSFQHIELRALERGYLQKVYVDEGQRVKKGQLLFQIMPLIYQAEVGKASAELKYAEIEYLNTQSLSDSNIVSKSELSLSKAKLDKAKAELNLADTHLGFTEIRAPFDGIMGRFHVRLGSLLDEGEIMSTLSDNSKMWVYFNVPEAQYLDFTAINSLDKLPEVSLQMANHKKFDQIGIIETIEADFNHENGNIAFRATFPNPNGMLRHGETGNILMPVPLEKALIIPQKATFEILDKKYVYVVGENDILETRQIIVGQEMPHLYTILDGLSKNDRILVDGLRKVKNKQKINMEFVPQDQILAELTKLHAE